MTKPQALLFDGNSYLKLTDNPKELKIDKNWTIEAWIKPTAEGDDFKVLGSWNITNWETWAIPKNSYGYLLSTIHRKPTFQLGFGNDANAIQVDATQALSTDKWSHVAYVSNSNAGTFELWIDGKRQTITIRDVDDELSATDIHSRTINYNEAKPLAFGAAPWNPDSKENKQFRFKGYLAEVRIWNRALSEYDINIKKNYRLDPAAETELVGYWRCNAIVETDQIIDCVANHNAIIHGNVQPKEQKDLQFKDYKELVKERENAIQVTNQQALLFNGGSYLQLKYQTATIQGEKNWTIEAWIQPTTEGDLKVFGTWNITDWNAIPKNSYGYLLTIKDGKPTFQLGFGNDANAIQVITEKSLPTDKWSHVAYVSNSNAGTFELWIDGKRQTITIRDVDDELSATDIHSRTINYNEAKPLAFGAAPWNPDSKENKQFRFKGYLAEVRIWNRALSEYDINIKKNYRLDPAAETELVGYWRCNAIVETDQIIDCVANHNAIIHGNVQPKEQKDLSLQSQT